MDGHHHYHHHLHQHQQQEELNYFQLQNPQYQVVPPLIHHDHPSHSSISVHGDVSDRFPQWSQRETKELISIRGELNETFMETKRNKQLWEVVATQMNDKGYNRSAEQCKCKWKNLVTRYKGCEIEEAQTMRQHFPFFNDLATIMVGRDHRTTWTTEADVVGGAGTSKSKKRLALSSDEDPDESAEAEDTRIVASAKKKRKVITKLGQQGGGSINVKEILGDFMRQQVKMEMQWREDFKARENERRVREFEWRKKMEAIENERLMMEREWREIEEQRRVKEEARAEKRDAILTALLDRINRGKL